MSEKAASPSASCEDRGHEKGDVDVKGQLLSEDILWVEDRYIVDQKCISSEMEKQIKLQVAKGSDAWAKGDAVPRASNSTRYTGSETRSPQQGWYPHIAQPRAAGTRC